MGIFSSNIGIENIRRENDELRAEVLRLDSVCSDLHQTIFDQSAEVERLTQDKKILTAQVENRDAEVERLRAELRDANEAVDALNRECHELHDAAPGGE